LHDEVNLFNDEDMAIDDGIISIDNWVIRTRRPDGVGPFPVLIMLHGWTGDEHSMWVFVPRLPKNALIIAPRGLYSTRANGYSWHPELPKPWPWISDFQPAVEKIFSTISLHNFPDGDFSQLNLIGFSQGTAMAYSMAILEPRRIASVAGLSGFLPDGASTWLTDDRLMELPMFIAHGTEDELVPVEKARQSVDLLEKAGAAVTYCEDNVGHKLSAKCFRGLEAFCQRVVD
jgi:phospholipase/carboxylesterase